MERGKDKQQRERKGKLLRSVWSVRPVVHTCDLKAEVGELPNAWEFKDSLVNREFQDSQGIPRLHRTTLSHKNKNKTNKIN